MPTTAGYLEEREKKDLEIHKLRDQMNKMNVVMNILASGFKRYKEEVRLYRDQYGGRRLTKDELEKIEQMLEWMRAHPNTDNTEDAD